MSDKDILVVIVDKITYINQIESIFSNESKFLFSIVDFEQVIVGWENGCRIL